MSQFDERSLSPSGSRLSHRKRLGGYLIEAGLITPAQVTVALNDQKMTGMRFGEILAARGWVKQETIEYLMRKVIIPEQKETQPSATRATAPNGATKQSQALIETAPSDRPQHSTQNGLDRRTPPVSKPLPSYSVNDENDGVSWVG